MSRRGMRLGCLLTLLAGSVGALPEPPAKLDRHGDPLPEGVVARLGTVRFRGAGMDAVVFSPDGSLLATSSGIRIRVWEARTGRRLGDYPIKEPLQGCVSFLAFSPDGRHLAAGFDEPPLRVWSVASGAEVQIKLDSYGRTFGGGFTADGRQLVVVSDNQVLLVERATHQVVRSWGVTFLPDERVRQEWGRGRAALAPDGRWLALITYHGRRPAVSVWDVPTGEELYRLGHPGRSRGLQRRWPDAR